MKGRALLGQVKRNSLSSWWMLSPTSTRCLCVFHFPLLQHRYLGAEANRVKTKEMGLIAENMNLGPSSKVPLVSVIWTDPVSFEWLEAGQDCVQKYPPASWLQEKGASLPPKAGKLIRTFKVVLCCFSNTMSDSEAQISILLSTHGSLPVCSR